MRTTRSPLFAAVCLLATTVLLGACGSSAGSDASVDAKAHASGTGATTTTGADTPTSTEAAGATGGSSAPGTPPLIPQTPANAKGCRTPEEAAAEKTAPDPDPPAKPETSIRVVDDIPGCGDPVTSTSTAKVQYLLKSKSSGKVVDSSWSRNEPFDVMLGQGQVISGWDLGIPGMRAGGRRTLYLGPDYGYGANGAGGDIAPNDTLVFVVDVLSVS
ncbi:MAG: peptidyl-prolyl cis-trans isomerase [Acidimicrobiales bacterium]|nr:peptidyl-prolyl cis-trans isomerase [Acidimicrobiales bacterium]